MKKNQKMKFKRAPGAPKRFKSAFMFFSEHQHKAIRDKSTNKRIRAADVAKVVSQSWKTLSDTERSHWIEIAQRDRERFEQERAAYNGPWKIPDVKDPDAPKKPMSAFLAFGNERRRAIAEANPTMNNTEISHVLSRLWRECPPDVKQQYKDREVRERAAFKKVRLEWERQKEQKFIQQNLNASAAKKPPVLLGTNTANETSLPVITSSTARPTIPVAFSSMAHPITTFSNTPLGKIVFQPLHPELSGSFPGLVAPGSFMHPTTTVTSLSSSNAVVSEESLDAYLSLDETSTSSETDSRFEPTPLDPPTSQYTMTREPTLSHFEGISMEHDDMMEELEMLGDLEDDDNDNDEVVGKQHAGLSQQQQQLQQQVAQSMHSWQQGYNNNNEASRSNNAAGYALQDTAQLAKLARELGDVGVNMLIGAFR